MPIGWYYNHVPLIGGDKGGRADIDRDEGVDGTQYVEMLAHSLLRSEGG